MVQCPRPLSVRPRHVDRIEREERPALSVLFAFVRSEARIDFDDDDETYARRSRRRGWTLGMARLVHREAAPTRPGRPRRHV